MHVFYITYLCKFPICMLCSMYRNHLNLRSMRIKFSNCCNYQHLYTLNHQMCNWNYKYHNLIYYHLNNLNNYYIINKRMESSSIHTIHLVLYNIQFNYYNSYRNLMAYSMLHWLNIALIYFNIMNMLIRMHLCIWYMTNTIDLSICINYLMNL